MTMKKSSSSRMSMKGGRDWKICRRLLGREEEGGGAWGGWGTGQLQQVSAVLGAR